MIYATKTEHMHPVAQGVDHGSAPISESEEK